jgi:hypothetical protein
MKIRAHHLLCIQGFQGYGYTEDFSNNMAEIIKKLDSNPKQIIEIIAECDIICSCCPYNKKEKCKNLIFNWTIKRMDKKVLKKIGLDVGTQASAENILSLVNKKFKTNHDIQEICRNCSWKEKCLWFISRSK